jgi:hypothetical protein
LVFRGRNITWKGRELGRISLSSIYPSFIVNPPLPLSRQSEEKNNKMNGGKRK